MGLVTVTDNESLRRLVSVLTEMPKICQAKNKRATLFGVTFHLIDELYRNAEHVVFDLSHYKTVTTFFATQSRLDVLPEDLGKIR